MTDSEITGWLPVNGAMVNEWVWKDKIGGHRVGVLDAARKSDIKKLFGKLKTDLIINDPPYNVKVGNFPYAGNGKAVAIGEPKGFIKTVFDADTDKILGVHMVGAEVTEMIAGLSIAKDMDATAEAISHVVFPHPSLSETIHESVLHALDKAIHI